MIYFIHDFKKERIKIGYSLNPTKRRGELKYYRGVSKLLRLLAVIPGTLKQEKELHKRFEACRVGKTEWFRMSDDLCCYISRLNPKTRLISESGNVWRSGIGKSLN